jgi:cobalt-zinc-cadmium efflux system membrane fusion protein
VKSTTSVKLDRGKAVVAIVMVAAAVVVAVAATVFATFIVKSGADQPASLSPPPSAVSASPSPPPEAAVDVVSNQLDAIKVDPVGTYLFPIEKEEVGSIGFDEDPATVQAESTLIGAAASFTLASNVLARAQALYGTNGVSKAELEQDVSAAETAGAALKAARDAVRALGKTDAEMDSMIAAGKIDSAPISTKWAVANVIESDSPLIQVGQPITVKVTAFPDRVFEGKVSKIFATVDSNLHRVEVRCEVDDPRDELRVGMLANIVIRIQDPVEAIAIPANGVVREGDGTMTAWVTTDRHHFVQRIVETGMRADGRVEILNGLQRGELVVTDGAVFLDNMLQAPADD